MQTDGSTCPEGWEHQNVPFSLGIEGEVWSPAKCGLIVNPGHYPPMYACRYSHHTLKWCFFVDVARAEYDAEWFYCETLLELAAHVHLALERYHGR